MNNYLDFTGKNIIVTGGLSGAGKKISEIFKEHNGNVIATYCHSTIIEEDYDCYYLDCGDTSSIEKFIKQLEKKYDHIDALINNAGIYPSCDLTNITYDVWDKMFDINTKGLFFLSREITKLMKQGSIVNISSINATNPSVTLTHYGASKAAVEFISKALAVKYGPNIRVNAIAPGLIYKKGQEEFIPGWVESYSERAPLKRIVLPQEIGKTALFLCSDLSSAITGQVITVDCGISLASWFDNRENI